MAIETVSFSTKSNGWNSFHSFIPDLMIGLNSSLYSWKNGELYKHNTNPSRNNYYGVSYPSTITSVFNENSLESKVFKTISIESNEPWSVSTITELGSGAIDSAEFKKKEGTFHGYIRRINGDIDPSMLSTQGIGALSNVSGPNLTFGSTFSNVSVGDDVYVLSGDTFTLVGNVFDYGSNTIEVSSVVNAPSPGDFLVSVKNSVAESYGERGDYMKVTLSTSLETQVELFTISSEVFKSYP